jgi:hypothetical protein
MAPCSKFPLFYPNECSLGAPLQPENQDQTIDPSRPEDMHLAMNIRLVHHHLQEDDLQDALSMEGQIDMIFTAQDHCRALHPHDALEPDHTLALSRSPHQGDGAHREDAQGTVDVEVQVTVATAQEPAATPIEAAAPAGTGLRGLTTDGDESRSKLIRAHPTKISCSDTICGPRGLLTLTVTTKQF